MHARHMRILTWSKLGTIAAYPTPVACRQRCLLGLHLRPLMVAVVKRSYCALLLILPAWLDDEKGVRRRGLKINGRRTRRKRRLVDAVRSTWSQKQVDQISRDSCSPAKQGSRSAWPGAMPALLAAHIYRELLAHERRISFNWDDNLSTRLTSPSTCRTESSKRLAMAHWRFCHASVLPVTGAR